VTHHNAEREDIRWLVNTGLGVRFWTAPHQVADLYTNDVAVWIYASSVFDISEFYLLNSYSVIFFIPVDENVIGLDVYGTLITAKMVYTCLTYLCGQCFRRATPQARVVYL
jgi:hypothetical protein